MAEKLVLSQTTIIYWLKKFGLKTKHTSKRSSIVWTTPKEEFAKIVRESSSIADILRSLGYDKHLNSALYRPVKQRIRENSLDVSHIQLGYNNNRGRSFTKHTKESYLEKMESETFDKVNRDIIRRLDIIPSENCSICSLGRTWNNLPLVLQLDHIDGNPKNNKPNNLRFVCPNCHTQTDNFCIGNRKILDAKKCEDCQNEITRCSTKCKKCASKENGEKSKKFNISKEELFDLVCVQKISFPQIGKQYSVEGNTIRKRCIALGINPKTRTLMP